ncbi:MAG: hypothetical protein JO023_05190 [Chloroflexi bacterium]|nr:hypothetical protein [Chloroflexota bacterium]
MRRITWAGWAVAGLLLLHNAAVGLAASGPNPLEGRLLQESNGTFYLYHDGFKFLLASADVGDSVIDAIPTATTDQWNTMFTTSEGSTAAPSSGLEEIAGQHSPAAPGQPAPFPGYS